MFGQLERKKSPAEREFDVPSRSYGIMGPARKNALNFSLNQSFTAGSSSGRGEASFRNADFIISSRLTRLPGLESAVITRN